MRQDSGRHEKLGNGVQLEARQFESGDLPTYARTAGKRAMKKGLKAAITRVFDMDLARASNRSHHRMGRPLGCRRLPAFLVRQSDKRSFRESRSPGTSAPMSRSRARWLRSDCICTASCIVLDRRLEGISCWGALRGASDSGFSRVRHGAGRRSQ